MNTKIIRGLIVTAIVLQCLWLLITPAGNGLAPRSPEMVQALRAFQTNRSPANSTAMWDQVRRDDLRDWHRKLAIFGLLLIADVAVIYFYWNYGANKPQRNKLQVSN